MALTDPQQTIPTPEVGTELQQPAPGASLDATIPRATGTKAAGPRSGADAGVSQAEPSSIEVTPEPEEQGWLSSAYDYVGDKLSGAADVVADTWNNSAVGQTVNAGANFVADTWNNSSVGQAVNSGVEAVGETVSEIYTVGQEKGVPAAIIHTLTMPANALAEAAQNSDIGIVRSIGNALDSGVSFFREMPTNSLGATLSYLGNSAGNAVTSLVSGAFSLVSSPIDSISNLFNNAISGRGFSFSDPSSTSDSSIFGSDVDALGRPLGPVPNNQVASSARDHMFGGTYGEYGPESFYALPTEANKANSAAGSDGLQIERGRVSLSVDQIARASTGVDVVTQNRIAASGDKALQDRLQNQPFALATTETVDQLQNFNKGSVGGIAYELSDLERLSLPKAKGEKKDDKPIRAKELIA